MLWVDKYRPTKLDDLSYHDEITERLSSLACNPSVLPHLFFYGPSGCGKKTRITCLLRALYGSSTERMKLDKRTFTTPTNRIVEIDMITSNHHIELCPGDAGLNDRYVIQDIIKEIASTKNVVMGMTTKKDGKSGNDDDDDDDDKKSKKQSASPSSSSFKTVVLVEVDQLSKQAQAALRRTMERYSHTCRLILCCNSQSKVIEPVRSRCLGIRIAAPTTDDICRVLQKIACRESFTLPDELALSIAMESSRNLRRAILMLEALHVQNRDGNGLTKDMPIPKTDWELYIVQIAQDMTREQTPQRLMATREKLYELLVNCIPATVIIKTLARELMKNLDDSIKPRVMEAAAFYEHRIATGSKEIFHLEAFVAKYMAIYKTYLQELFD